GGVRGRAGSLDVTGCGSAAGEGWLDDGRPLNGGVHAGEGAPEVVAGDGEDEAVAPAHGGGADEALAGDAAEERIELHLERDAGSIHMALAEGDARHLRE